MQNPGRLPARGFLLGFIQTSMRVYGCRLTALVHDLLSAAGQAAAQLQAIAPVINEHPDSVGAVYRPTEESIK